MYEGGIRVPMIVRWPGRTTAGVESAVPVQSMDLFPTLLEVAGLPARPKAHLDGASLAPLLRGGDAPDRDALYWHYPHYGNQGGAPAGAIRSGSWKLVEWFEDGRLELFDLVADPGETADVSAEEAEQVAELHARLVAWRAEVGARMPAVNAGFDAEAREGR